MLSLCSLIPPGVPKLSSSLFLTHCFWTVMGTEGISKGLEPPASSLSAPLAPGYLSCSCAAPPKGTELSLAQGKVERGWRMLQAWEHELPSSSFPSWSPGNIQPPGLLFCVPLTTMHGLDVQCSFTAFHLCHRELLFFGRSWRKELGAAPRLGKESWFTVSLETKQVLKAWGPHSRATIAPCCALSPPHLWSAKT